MWQNVRLVAAHPPFPHQLHWQKVSNEIFSDFYELLLPSWSIYTNVIYLLRSNTLYIHCKLTIYLKTQVFR